MVTKSKDRIEKFWMQNFSEKIEEMKQHAAHRSARYNPPLDLEHPSAVEIEEEREDQEPLSRRSLSANQAKDHENRLDLVSD